MNLRCPRCIECRYLRQGLPEDAPCPECSAPAPPREWLVVFGSSTEADPRWGMVVASAMTAAGLGLGTLLWVTRTGPPAAMAVALTVGGLILLMRVKRSADQLPEGGDVLWIVKEEGVEVRGGFHKRFWPWDEITYALFERGWRTVRLSFGGPFSNTSNEAWLWLPTKEQDGRAIHQELRERIASARAREPGTGTPELSPPASPPPPPS